MKYKVSELKLLFNQLGVFNISILNAVNNDYTNGFDITATQWTGQMEVNHKITALTLKDGFDTLLKRAQAIHQMQNDIKPIDFAVPNIGERNMVGHVKDGNIDIIKDILP